MSSVVFPQERSSTGFVLAGWGTVPRVAVISGVLLVILLVAMIFSAATGPTPVPLTDVANAFLHYIGVDRGVDTNSVAYRIVILVRLPAIMVAALVGAALASAGVTMQGLFRNPLADPGVIGVSAGASFGVVLTITQFVIVEDLWLFGRDPVSGMLWRVPIAAFVGALSAALLVYVLSLQHGRTHLAALLLVGVALNAVLGALTSLLLLRTADFEAVRAVLSWLVGSLEGRGWAYFDVAKWPIALAAIGLMLFTKELNLLALGEESAQALGVNVPRTRFWLLVLSSLLTASAVSIAGAIGFVGLVVPHLLRLIVGPDHRVLLPTSLVGGAAFMVIADALARSLVAPEVLPVGTLTALMGAPLFLILLWRNRHQIAVF